MAALSAEVLRLLLPVVGRPGSHLKLSPLPDPFRLLAEFRLLCFLLFGSPISKTSIEQLPGIKHLSRFKSPAFLSLIAGNTLKSLKD